MTNKAKEKILAILENHSDNNFDSEIVRENIADKILSSLTIKDIIVNIDGNEMAKIEYK